MFRLWGKLCKDNRIINDLVVTDESSNTRTRKVFAAITSLCLHFDLSEPIWLKSNITEFKHISKTRFTKDNFIESVPFDYMEIQVLEED